MAIYHSRVKTFSRARGDSSVAAAAYRAGLLLIDHLTGQRHDYRRRGGVVESVCLVPEDAPDWALVPGELWPAAEAAETRKNSTVAREFEVALPHELNDEQRSELATAIGQALIGRYGFAVQASIHTPGSRDGLNHHVHLLATTRRLTSEGFGEKTRELDGGASGKIEIEWVRKTIASTINEHLKAAGVDQRVDHRRLEVQAEDALARGDIAEAMALSRQPTKHLGKTASALERKGLTTDRGTENARIVEDNEQAFDDLLAQAEREGRAAPVPGGHSQAQARKERRERSASSLTANSPFPGLEIYGLTGIRMNNLVRKPKPRDLNEAPERSVGDLLADAAHSLAEIVVLRSSLALAATHHLLQQLREWGQRVDPGDLRRDLAILVKGLNRLKKRLTKFAQRVAAVGRAERLFHMAERSLEDYNADYPDRGGVWSTGEWAQRRARRQATLRARTIELKATKASITPEAEAACEAEIAIAAGQLEEWSQHASLKYAALSPHTIVGKEFDASPPAPVLAPRPRRPRP
ncbi:MobA/MobL family protein [Xanthomonas citri pv. malvacearum str. GSPB2388]|uniref:MobA/MobL family protein n=1 Tax=Xanthomonas citri TaxID=346 RepID=UPI0002982E79|nr:MobA/MobL family protein [Xanthomonas citri]EKQ61989.1 MobA/MobL family protein [Xanthomonas citri pv. malvacearum str. GSPB2388]